MLNPVEFRILLKHRVPMFRFEPKQILGVGDKTDLRFIVNDMSPEELVGANAIVHFLMEDGTRINGEDVELRDGNVFSYRMTERETGHVGLVRVELMVTLDDSVANSEICEFDVVPTLKSIVEKEVILPDLDRIKSEVAEAVEKLNTAEKTVSMLLRNTLTLTDDYGVDWEISADTDGTLLTNKKEKNIWANR